MPIIFTNCIRSAGQFLFALKYQKMNYFLINDLNRCLNECDENNNIMFDYFYFAF